MGTGARLREEQEDLTVALVAAAVPVAMDKVVA